MAGPRPPNVGPNPPVQSQCEGTRRRAALLRPEEQSAGHLPARRGMSGKVLFLIVPFGELHLGGLGAVHLHDLAAVVVMVVAHCRPKLVCSIL